MLPGDELELRGDLRVRAVRTFHPVPSLAYIFARRVSKLRGEFRGLPGEEIAARRRAGEAMLEHEDRLELAYATDTLVTALDRAPDLLRARVLVVECTFPLALLWPVSRWFYVPGVVGMHAGIYATMHLNYVAMASTVIIVYVNWAWIADRLKERSAERRPLRPAPART